ncbi:MAG: flagellar basal body L-ring protein FlgH [Actinomycetota bacterium]
MRSLAAASCVLLLSACAVVPPQPPAVGGDVPLPLAPTARRGQAGGVFVADTPWSLISDARVFRAGDVLTVVLQETTQASKKADTQFGKSSTANVLPLSVLGKTYHQAAISMDAQRDFSGSATSTQQNALQGAITVVVHEVLPNGLLRVQGEKSLYLNQGEEMIRVSGYVRAADIDTDNRVSSQRIANARIVYAGSGTLADANSPGWLTRFFTSPWMPF